MNSKALHSKNIEYLFQKIYNYILFKDKDIASMGQEG